MKIQNDINLGKKTTLKIWWNSKYFAEIKNKEDLLEVFKYSKKNKLKIIPLWLWSNVFFSWELENVIIVKLGNWEVEKIKSHHELVSGSLALWVSKKMNNKEDSEINSEWKFFFQIWAWAVLWNVINQLAKEDFDLSPLTWFPSSIWWAIAWNAWLLWKEIKDYLVSAEVFNLKTWEFEIWKNEDFEFDYRFSKLKWKNEYLVWSWIFKIPKWDNLKEKISELMKIRWEKQPQWRCAWSFFKNPPWDYAGRLIEEVWLKWYKIWGAYFSEKHANFLMTEKWVKIDDVIDLKNLAKAKVKEKFWIDLEEEVVIY